MNDAAQSESTTPEKALATTSSWHSLTLKVIGFILLLIAFLLMFFGGIAYFGWNSGATIRMEQMALNEQQEREHQFNLAQADVAAGRYELALRRLEWLLARDKNYPGAAELQLEAQMALIPTATPSPTAAPSPTSEVSTETGGDTKAADEQITAIEALVEAGDWEEAVQAITNFQIDFPSYRRAETDQLLYEAYSRWGSYLLNNNQIAKGLFYLEQAQTLGDLPDWMEGEIVFAELYLEGIVFYNVNWPAYLYYFRELCSYAPNFQNSCKLLTEGLLAYGDQLSNQLDWCPAAAHYREALPILGSADEQLRFKIEQADTGCQAATPTPDPAAVITATVPITNTVPTNP